MSEAAKRFRMRAVSAGLALTLVAAVTAGCSTATAPKEALGPANSGEKAGLNAGEFNVPEWEKFRFLFTTDEFSNTVSAIDTKTMRTIDSLMVGKLPHMGGITPDGKMLFIGNRGGNDITIIDVQKLKVVKNLTLGQGPNHGVVSPDGKYVAFNHGRDLKVAFIDAKTWEVVKVLDVGEPPKDPIKGYYMEHNFWSWDSRYLWSQDKVNNRAIRIDTQTWEVKKVQMESPIHTLYIHPGRDVVMTVNESKPGQPFTVSAIDAKEAKLIKTITIPTDPGEGIEGHHGTYTLDGKFFVAASRGRGTPLRTGKTVGIIDMDKLELIKTVKTGNGASHPVADPKGRYIAVSNSDENYVSFLDAKTFDLVKNVTTGKAKRLEHGAFTEDGKYFFQISYGDDAVYAIDMDKMETVAKMPVGRSPHDLMWQWKNGGR